MEGPDVANRFGKPWQCFQRIDCLEQVRHALVVGQLDAALGPAKPVFAKGLANVRNACGRLLGCRAWASAETRSKAIANILFLSIQQQVAQSIVKCLAVFHQRDFNHPFTACQLDNPRTFFIFGTKRAKRPELPGRDIDSRHYDCQGCIRLHFLASRRNQKRFYHIDRKKTIARKMLVSCFEIVTRERSEASFDGRYFIPARGNSESA